MRYRLQALLLSAAFATCLHAATAVRVVTPAAREKASTLTVASSLMVENDVVVTTRVSGVVESIEADRGAEVKKGQALATLDQREFQLDRRAAEESLNLSQLEYLRYKELHDQKLASQTELEQRKAAYELAQVEFEKAKLVIDRSVVRAPFDGIVVDRMVRVGQKVLLDEAGPLFRIMALEPLLARAYLPDSALRRVKAGESVVVTSTELEARSAGQVAFVSPVVDAASGTVQVIVKVARDRERILRPGMAVQLTFSTGPLRRSSLPAECLVEKDARGRGTVLQVEDGVLRARAIQFERGEGATIEVLSGLREGASVVRGPTPSLSDGEKVTIAP